MARIGQTRQEWAYYYSRQDVYGLDFLHANFIRHRYPRHVHDFYVFGIIEMGRQTFSYRSDKHKTAQGGLIILNPDEPHTGESASESGFMWKAIYPSADLLRRVAAQLSDHGTSLPFFKGPVIYDQTLASQFLRLHRALTDSGCALGSETLLLNFLATAFIRYAYTHFELTQTSLPSQAIGRVRDYLEEHYSEPISLDNLAQLVAISPFHLARLFNNQLGIPPHAYLESVRIRHAQRLLALGQPIVEVALATGFADQSHFTQRFKRAVGVPPGQYAKARKITQDAHS